MPKIQVNEKDLSWYYRQRESGQLVVFMPGVATFGPHEPTLVDDKNFAQVFGTSSVHSDDISYHQARSFVKAGLSVLFWRVSLEDEAVACTRSIDSAGNYGSVVVSAKYAGSFGNNLSVVIRGSRGGIRTFVVYDKNTNVVLETVIANFVDRSSEYWYENVNEDSKYITVGIVEGGTFFENEIYSTQRRVLEGGSNGTYSKEGILEYILGEGKSATVNGVEVISYSGHPILRELRDPLSYDFNVIVDGGYNDHSIKPEDDSTPSSISSIDEIYINLAEKKGNAIYLVDGRKNFTAEQFYQYTALPSDGSEPVDVEKRGFDTSYAAAYGPWGSYKMLSDGSTRILPGSYVLLVSWGQSLANGNPIWMAPAGVKRASVGSIVKTTNYPVGSAILDMWQNHEEISDSVYSDHKINPIMELKRYGYVIYGNSTLLRNRYDGATSMLQSFSTRVLSNVIKTRAFDISLGLQFDQIDDSLFAEFKALMTVFMDQLKYGGALYDYQIVVDRSELTLDDLNSRTVPVRIMISPNPAVENFIINLEISQAGVTFGDDTDGNISLEEA